MTAYIEFVILDNFTLTMLLAYCSYRVLRVRASLFRSILCAILGTLTAVVYPLFTVQIAVVWLIKLSLGAILAMILFFKKCNVIKGYLVFMVLTFMFGGLMFCIGLMLYADIEKALTMPISNVPIFVIIIAATLITFVIKLLSTKLHKIADADDFIIDFGLEINCKKVKAKGFVDTGNRLYDSKSGLPVVLISLKCILPTLTNSQIAQYLNGNGLSVFKNARYITFSTAAGSDKLLIFSPDNFYFYIKDKVHILNDVMIGLGASLADAVSYDAILHPSILKGWRNYKNEAC